MGKQWYGVRTREVWTGARWVWSGVRRWGSGVSSGAGSHSKHKKMKNKASEKKEKKILISEKFYLPLCAHPETTSKKCRWISRFRRGRNSWNGAMNVTVCSRRTRTDRYKIKSIRSIFSFIHDVQGPHLGGLTNPWHLAGIWITEDYLKEISNTYSPKGATRPIQGCALAVI